MKGTGLKGERDLSVNLQKNCHRLTSFLLRAASHEELIASCYHQLTVLAEKQQAYDASALHGAHRLQPLWNGRDTDWPTLLSALEALDDPAVSPLLERLARLMAAHPRDDWAARFQLLALHDPQALCNALSPILPELLRMSAAEA